MMNSRKKLLLIYILCIYNISSNTSNEEIMHDPTFNLPENAVIREIDCEECLLETYNVQADQGQELVPAICTSRCTKKTETKKEQ